MKYNFLTQNGQLRGVWQICLGIFCYISGEKLADFIHIIFSYTSIQENNILLYKSIVTIVQLLVLYFMYKWLFEFGYNSQLHYLEDIDCFKISKKGIKQLFIGFFIAIIAFSAVLLPLYATKSAYLLFNGFYIKEQLILFLGYLPVAFGEELLFRGSLQHTLLRNNKWLSVLILSIIFGYMHLESSAVYFSSLCMAGLVMGVMMYATNSIQTSIGFHFAWDWVQTSIYGVSTNESPFTVGIFRTRFSSDDKIAPVQSTIESMGKLVTLILLLITFIFFLYGFLKRRYDVYNSVN